MQERQTPAGGTTTLAVDPFAFPALSWSVVYAVIEPETLVEHWLKWQGGDLTSKYKSNTSQTAGGTFSSKNCKKTANGRRD
jgi:hypothetical protein